MHSYNILTLRVSESRQGHIQRSWISALPVISVPYKGCLIQAGMWWHTRKGLPKRLFLFLRKVCRWERTAKHLGPRIEHILAWFLPLGVTQMSLVTSELCQFHLTSGCSIEHSLMIILRAPGMAKAMDWVLNKVLLLLLLLLKPKSLTCCPGDWHPRSTYEPWWKLNMSLKVHFLEC